MNERVAATRFFSRGDEHEAQVRNGLGLFFFCMTPEVQMQQQQAAGPSQMLQAQGRPAADPQAVDDAARQVQQQFIQLETGLQQFVQQIGQLVQQYPAFGKHAQGIGEAVESVHTALNQGMLDSIQELRTQEPPAPPY